MKVRAEQIGRRDIPGSNGSLNRARANDSGMSTLSCCKRANQVLAARGSGEAAARDDRREALLSTSVVQGAFSVQALFSIR